MREPCWSVAGGACPLPAARLGQPSCSRCARAPVGGGDRSVPRVGGGEEQRPVLGAPCQGWDIPAGLLSSPSTPRAVPTHILTPFATFSIS